MTESSESQRPQQRALFNLQSTPEFPEKNDKIQASGKQKTQPKYFVFPDDSSVTGSEQPELELQESQLEIAGSSEGRSQRVSVLSKGIESSSSHENMPDPEQNVRKEAPKELQSPLAKAMLAKFDETFQSSPVEKKKSKRLKIYAFKHLESVEQDILRISQRKGWQINASEDVKLSS